MSRLQKKCFIGASSLHGLLLLALLVGPGFFTKQTVDDAPMITIIPMTATDANLHGGGSPRPPENPPQQPVVQPQPTPPEPVVRKEVEKEETVKPEPEKIKRNDPDAPVVKNEKPPRHEVKVSNRVVKLAKNTTKSPNNNPTPTDAETKANAQLKRAIAAAGQNISTGLSSSTKIDMPDGFGGGGVSYAPYGQIVRKIYTDGWQVPDDMTDDEATIKVSVTIARDGTVLSARIVQPSGSAAANRSIQNTLDRITSIGVAFPAGAKESQRTFIMTFNLKAKKAFG